ncbi:beta-galactosidase [Actinophytocola algeriensis]|uniref:beta-galactosidase n=1 Tax=Actinophytocola algeriensis TaxID=1768010 RepID=A0A7W7QBE8_9PSEU|nr:beta-galactosidase [Actinophytocola algeriensis]MBB4910061.1 beta-galactosidase GanA [Actinophytocola algeriensis]MBE1476051.1 beta-galactosidase GanA [Actinophytocola algeriensis]
MRRLALLLVLLLVTGAATPVAAAAPAHTVSYDRYSLKVDGERVFLWSGEFHYFRLPSPELWRDVLEKIRAAGFNGVSLYFNWAYHSPAPGEYDFSGVRDVDRLLRLTEELGLYVVARPGPYINAEVSGGGFPAWLKQVDGRARSSDPGYTAAYREWLSHINPILARHQITRGGSVIAYNVENEYAANTDAQYMQDLQDTARAAGIDVPITHNQCCDASWTPTWASGLGAVQIPGVDDYPQSFECQTPDVWGPWGPGTTERLSDNAPVYAAEYQAGAIDLNRAGYDRCRELTGPSYMRYFYKSNLITSGATMFGYYMAFGGTNWGWLGQPNDVYTSYDYGAAITESRQLTDKYAEFKRQGYFVRAVEPLRHTDTATAPPSSDAAVETLARANPSTGTQFVLARSLDGGSSTLDWSTPDGRYSVPVTVGARDALVLVAGYDLGGQRLVWSSSELMTHTRSGGRDVALLYGRTGTDGSTVLRYGSRPAVQVLAGSVRSSFAGGDLKLDYRHEGLSRVLVTGGGRPPMLLLLGTNETAAEFWQFGSVLVRSPSLVRDATVSGSTVTLRADTSARTSVEVFAPARRLVVGHGVVPTRTTSSGSLAGTLRGPDPVRLPTLTGWRTQREPVADDSGWTVADRGLPSGTYGYDQGHVWYRGHFTAGGTETAVKLNAITGKNGVYQVWLNGTYLGWAKGGTQADSDAPVNPDPGPGTFTLPPLAPGTPAVLSVLVGNMGHNDDWTADDTRFKQPRGLVGAALIGADTPVSWRLRGNEPDPVRGPFNTGGLLGERAGWHLPGHRSGDWRPAPDTLAPGVTWYRTEFALDLPRDQDVPVALRFDGTGAYRVLMYVNGWQMGQFTADLGPQKEFVLPAGVLRTHGKNTVALAVIALEESTPGPVSLVPLANHRVR